MKKPLSQAYNEELKKLGRSLSAGRRDMRGDIAIAHADRTRRARQTSAN